MAESTSSLPLNPFTNAPLSQAFARAWSDWVEFWLALPPALSPEERVAKSAEHASMVARRLWRSSFAAVGDAGGRQAKATLFAFVALVDETLLFSDWNGRDEWQTRPLEVRLFGSRSAGDRLPLAIGRLLQARDPATRDLANVYLHCMILGFQGRLRRGNGLAVHERWRRSLFTFTRQRSPSEEHGLQHLSSTAALPPQQVPLKRSLPDSVRLGMAIAVGFVVLLGISQLFWWNITQRLSPAIEQALEQGLSSPVTEHDH